MNHVGIYRKFSVTSFDGVVDHGDAVVWSIKCLCTPSSIKIQSNSAVLSCDHESMARDSVQCRLGHKRSQIDRAIIAVLPGFQSSASWSKRKSNRRGRGQLEGGLLAWY